MSYPWKTQGSYGKNSNSKSSRSFTRKFVQTHLNKVWLMSTFFMVGSSHPPRFLNIISDRTGFFLAENRLSTLLNSLVQVMIMHKKNAVCKLTRSLKKNWSVPLQSTWRRGKTIGANVFHLISKRASWLHSPNDESRKDNQRVKKTSRI
jgi:hypothetical protein